MNLNSSPSHFPMHQITHDPSDHELYLHHPFLPNPSPSVSCHFFFDPSQHHSGFYDHHHHLYRPNHVPDDQDYGGSSTYDEIKNKVVDSSGLKLGLWKKEDVVDDDDDEYRQSKHNNPMKWMSSKMRVMQKMKHTDHHDRAALKITSSADQKVQQPSSSSAETTDLSSNSSSYNNNNSPIRVCSDCNTTKTPLWRSGPKGPKSLCNACGIRQRKARRAMAAAAAAAAAAATNGAAASTSDQSSAVKIKLQHKGKLGKNGHPSQLKKKCKTAVAAAAAATTTTATGSPPSTGKKQLGFEEFLISLSKNLAFHHVFPDDEKDAAILLMALSSGLVNG